MPQRIDIRCLKHAMLVPEIKKKILWVWIILKYKMKRYLYSEKMKNTTLHSDTFQTFAAAAAPT